MHRTNSARDAAASGLVQVDAGEGVTLTVPVTPSEGGGGVSPDHPALYDSGWRDVTSSLGSAVAADSVGKYFLRRQGGMVLARFENVKLVGGGSTNLAWSSLPSGFRPVGTGGGAQMFEIGTAVRSGGTVFVMPDAAHIRLQGARPAQWSPITADIPAGQIVQGAISFATVDAVPTTLPGTPA